MTDAKVDLGRMAEHWKGTLVDLLGIKIVEASPERVVAQLRTGEEQKTVGGALHGGTTTLESKTNFFAAGRSGAVRAETTPLHRGKRTMGWQTRVSDDSGRLLSLTIQTQMVL